MASQYSNWIIAVDEQEKELLDKVKRVYHYYVECQTEGEKSKYAATAQIAAMRRLTAVTDGHVIIFCRTIEMAKWLVAKLTESGQSCALVNGQEVEDKAVEDKEGEDEAVEDKKDKDEAVADEPSEIINCVSKFKEKILITTDHLVTGVVVSPVSLVVNYDLPYDIDNKADCETYLRRIERVDIVEMGKVINLVHGDKAKKAMKTISDKLKLSLIWREPNVIGQV